MGCFLGLVLLYGPSLTLLSGSESTLPSKWSLWIGWVVGGDVGWGRLAGSLFWLWSGGVELIWVVKGVMGGILDVGLLGFVGPGRPT